MGRAHHLGFSLIDLIAAIGVVGLTISVVAPAVQQAREAARRTQCKNNLKQIGLALHNYRDAHGIYPPAYIDDDHDLTGAMHTGFVMILPFLEEAALFNAYNSREGRIQHCGLDQRTMDL